VAVWGVVESCVPQALLWCLMCLCVYDNVCVPHHVYAYDTVCGL
jgi:hypothetical protein